MLIKRNNKIVTNEFGVLVETKESSMYGNGSSFMATIKRYTYIYDM